MSRIGCRSYIIKSLGVALAFFLSPISRGSELGPLPFDHRRLLLVKMDQTQIPAPRVLSQILDDMRTKGRYQWVLASRPGESIAPVRVPRDFSWDSPPSVQKMAERYNVDGVLWIQQRDQEILLKWYDGKGGLPLVFESTFLRSDGKDPEQDALRVSAWMSSVWARFPGVGFVAKRDSKYLYFEGAEENTLKAGDLVKIIRVESVSRHKLFKTLAEFKTSQVGQAKIVAVEKLLAKAEVTEESSLDPVKMGDRYELVPIQVAPETIETKVAPPTSQVLGDLPPMTSDGMGAVGVSLGYGKTAHSEEATNGADPSLARNAPAFEFDAMAYVTTRWMAWVNYRYRFATFTDPSIEYPQASIAARFTSAGLSVGHRFMIDETAGLWIAPFAGFRSYSFSVSSGDQDPNYGPTTKLFKSLAIGFHLRFPFNDVWSAKLLASKSMFLAYSEKDETSGGTPRPTAAELGATVWARTFEDSSLGLGFRYQTLGVVYEGAGTRGETSKNASLKISELLVSYETRF